MMFDVKMEDFRRKACPVVGSHITQRSDVNEYSSVVTR